MRQKVDEPSRQSNEKQKGKEQRGIGVSRNVLAQSGAFQDGEDVEEIVEPEPGQDEEAREKVAFDGDANDIFVFVVDAGHFLDKGRGGQGEERDRSDSQHSSIKTRRNGGPVIRSHLKAPISDSQETKKRKKPWPLDASRLRPDSRLFQRCLRFHGNRHPKSSSQCGNLWVWGPISPCYYDYLYVLGLIGTVRSQL